MLCFAYLRNKMYIFDPTNGYNLSNNPSADDEPTEIQQYGDKYGWSNINVNMIFNGNDYQTFDTIDEFKKVGVMEIFLHTNGILMDKDTSVKLILE